MLIMWGMEKKIIKTEDLVEFMAENKMELTQENIQRAAEHVHERFVIKNFKDMMFAYGKDVESKVTESLDKKLANPKPQEDTQKPVDEVEKEDAEFNAWLKEGVNAPKDGEALFK